MNFSHIFFYDIIIWKGVFMKIDRLMGILMILINKEKVTAKYLAHHFEVSVRTIQRDIDTLTLAGIPLYADVGANGGYQLMADYKLEKGFLNKDEAGLLMSFLKGLEKAVPYSEVKSINNKFSNLTHTQLDANKFAIQLNPGLDTKLFRTHLSLISKARDELKKLSITYTNIDFSESTRIICPHTLVLYTSNWYVYAYCELRADFRMFKLHRIIDCELLPESYELKPLPEILPWEEPITSHTQTTKIVLEIDKKLQGKLPDYFGPDVCTIHDDHISVILNFPLDEWVYSLLMSLVPYIKVIEPNFLREEFKTRLKKCFDLNNYDI